MDFKEQYDEKFRNSFNNSTDSKMSVEIDYERKSIDYKWLEVFEDVIRYIDNIVRNPKKFIINEEEVVKIEQSKKVTVESVIHLTQHTNYIQKIENNGDVKPSKILNINKEEDLGTYENRFIYTLIRKMERFLIEHEEDISATSYCHDRKEITYAANTVLNNEKVNVSLKLNSVNDSSLIPENVGGMTLGDRYQKLKYQFGGILNSELYQTLLKNHTIEVKPPIKKTNLILKNPNFQKAVEAWNFLADYDTNTVKLSKEKKNYMDSGILKEKFDESFFLNYLAVNTVINNSKEKSSDSFLNMTINKVIEYVLETDEDISKAEFDKIISQEFKKAKEKIKYRDKIIQNTLNNKITKAFNKFENAISFLE